MMIVKAMLMYATLYLVVQLIIRARYRQTISTTLMLLFAASATGLAAAFGFFE